MPWVRGPKAGATVACFAGAGAAGFCVGVAGSGLLGGFDCAVGVAGRGFLGAVL